MRSLEAIRALWKGTPIGTDLELKPGLFYVEEIGEGAWGHKALLQFDCPRDYLAFLRYAVIGSALERQTSGAQKGKKKATTDADKLALLGAKKRGYYTTAIGLLEKALVAAREPSSRVVDAIQSALDDLADDCTETFRACGSLRWALSSEAADAAFAWAEETIGDDEGEYELENAREVMKLKKLLDAKKFNEKNATHRKLVRNLVDAMSNFEDVHASRIVPPSQT